MHCPNVYIYVYAPKCTLLFVFTIKYYSRTRPHHDLLQCVRDVRFSVAGSLVTVDSFIKRPKGERTAVESTMCPRKTRYDDIPCQTIYHFTGTYPNIGCFRGRDGFFGYLFPDDFPGTRSPIQHGN